MSFQLKHHKRTFDFLRVTPSFSFILLDQIKQKEKELDIKLPEALVEWCAIENSVELLKKYSNSDYPNSINELIVIDDDKLQLMFLTIWNNYEVGGEKCSDWHLWSNSNKNLVKLKEIILKVRDLKDKLFKY